MNRAILSFVLFASATPMFAHRLDEYLQAAAISLGKDRITLEMRLSPGVAVAPMVLAGIDRNGDGVFSDAEETAYVEQLLRDVSVTLDGEPLIFHSTSKTFASIDALREGRGEILIQFFASVTGSKSKERKLTFENHHQKQIAAYLVNTYTPSDPDLQIIAQDRNYNQSSYRLDYAQAAPSSPVGQRITLVVILLLMSSRFVFVLRRGNSSTFFPGKPDFELPLWRRKPHSHRMDIGIRRHHNPDASIRGFEV
jgi:hypothetical protein